MTRWTRAKVAHRCADCHGTIYAGQKYVPVNEYGERRTLHVECAEKRDADATGAK